MKILQSLQFSFSRRAVPLFGLLLFSLPVLLSAQVPPRFYWKTLSGSNGIPVIYMSMSGNANPLDPAKVVDANAVFDAEVVIAGYAKITTLFDRAAMIAVLQPMGRITAQTQVAAGSSIEQNSGFGDPLVELAINLVGPPPIKSIPDLMRYEPGFSLDLIVDLVIPIGEYDSDKTVNLAQNRWYGRVGFPVVWQLSSWVPGRRMTLELLPSLWVFDDNDDLGGLTLETDPMFQIEGHLTRDFTEAAWGSFDTIWITGGRSTIQGHAGDSIDNVGVCFLQDSQPTENLQMTLGYMSSVSDSAPTDLQMDAFKVSLTYGWHRVIEGIGRLGSGG